MYGYCEKCRTVHDWVTEPFADCVPPLYVIKLMTATGAIVEIPGRYRLALFEHAPWYTVAEIIMTFKGFNAEFASFDQWQREKASPCRGDEQWGQFVEI